MTISDRPVALITGASKRIGAVIARKLHHCGYNIAIHYGRSEVEARTLADELNCSVDNSADIFQADLGDLASIARMASAVQSRWGRVDAIVNNASSFHPTPLGYSDETDWNELFNSNLKGPYFLVQSLAGSLRQQRGSIVNITDINAGQPLKDYPIYCIAKAGNAMMTRTLAKELAPEVRVNGIAPGSILWPEGKAAMTDQDKADLLDKIPLKRLGTPQDIAEIVYFLLTSAGYITGQVIAVDGGLGLQASAN